jgi:hypothetical protein
MDTRTSSNTADTLTSTRRVKTEADLKQDRALLQKRPTTPTPLLCLPLSLPLPPDLARGGNPRRRSSALRASPPPPLLPLRLDLQQRLAETAVSFAVTPGSAPQVPTLAQTDSQKSALVCTRCNPPR